MHVFLETERMVRPARRSRTISCRHSWATTSVIRRSGSGRRSRNLPGISWAGSTSGRGREAPRARSSSVTGCASRPGARGTPPKGRALIRKGFTESGVQRVTAEAMAANTASRRVMEKAGLTLVRTFSQPSPGAAGGHPVEVVEYALNKAGWEQRDQGSAGAASQQ